MSGLVKQADEALTSLFSSWNLYTTAISLAIFALLVYTILSTDEPDTHPMLLLRQASAAGVRQPGESALYRSHETPHGYPLKTGLNVRPLGAPMYSAGKDGDLRDIWRRVSGEIPLELPQGKGKSEKGKLLTVFGLEKVEDVDLIAMGKEIAIIGEAVRKAGGSKVAVYLPNSTELLVVLFAGAFYGQDVLLIPYNQPQDSVIDQLKSTNADTLVAQAGSLPLARVTNLAGSLKQVILVVEQTSRHIDWTEVPEDFGGKINVSAWHEFVKDASAGLELPRDGTPGTIVMFNWQEKSSKYEIVEFTQENIVAAVGALITALPPSQRFSPSDLFLPADSLTSCYTLCLTLAALFQHSTVAINSVAGQDVQLATCALGIAPTIIVTSARCGFGLLKGRDQTASGLMAKIAHSSATTTLKSGRMPGGGALARLNAPKSVAIGTTPRKLRLLFLAEKAGAGDRAVSSAALSDLRMYTGARVIYALTSPRVAGAVAQTHIFDYRTGSADEKYNHFGGVLSSIEVKVVDSGDMKTEDEGRPQGEIVAMGPAVAGDEAHLGIGGTFNDDGTLAYLCGPDGQPVI